MNRSKVYLIANNRSPTQTMLEYVSNIENNEDDVVVVFNDPVNHFADRLSKIDISVFCGKHNGYFGVYNNLKINSKSMRANKFFFRGNKPNLVKQIVEKNNVDPAKYSIHNVVNTFKYKDYEFTYKVHTMNSKIWGTYKKLSTTGFQYLFYFLNEYPDHEIVLVGFKLSGKNGWHDHETETKVIKDLVDLGYVTLIS